MAESLDERSRGARLATRGRWRMLR